MNGKMEETYGITPIARIYTDFPDKFGIPRQSGRVPELTGRIVFEPRFRSPDAVRGMEGYSHLWLIWQFSQNTGNGWNATVRPPRLGGNTRMGVFATRSPFRPNSLGLSVVKIEDICPESGDGPVITVSGVDMVDGTPIFDIKPYLPHVDAIPEAAGGFAREAEEYGLYVNCSDDLLASIPEEKRQALIGVLREDPRPAYQDDPQRVYGFAFAGYEVRFRVSGGELTVVSIEKKE